MTTTPIPESADATVEALRSAATRAEIEARLFSGCVRALLKHTNPFLVNEGHAQQWHAVSDAIGNRVEPALDVLSAALAHTPNAATSAPEGWALVPREPTDEMLAATAPDAAGMSERYKSFCYEQAQHLYHAMLAAAPPAPAAPAAEPDAGVRDLRALAEEIYDDWLDWHTASSRYYAGRGDETAKAALVGLIVEGFELAAAPSHPQPASPELGARLAELSARAPKGEWTVTFDEVGEGPDRKPIAFLENDGSILAVDEDPEASEYLSPTLELSAELVNAYRAGHPTVTTPRPDPESRSANEDGCTPLNTHQMRELIRLQSADIERLEAALHEPRPADVEGLREALAFYSNSDNWIDTPSWDGDPSCITEKAIPVDRSQDGSPCDCGDIARKAITAFSAAQPATPSHPAHRGAEEARRVAAEVLKAGDLNFEWTLRGYRVAFTFKSKPKALFAYECTKAALATLSSATADQTEGRS